MHQLREGPLSALDAIFMRRSVRAYTEQTLDESTIRALLDAAVQAPTAMHTEPWAFVIVQDRNASLYATETKRSPSVAISRPAPAAALGYFADRSSSVMVEKAA